MDTRRIFWDVDTQRDFVEPEGKLYVPGAEAILRNLASLTRWAADHNVLVIASACAHHPDDPEFQHWPPHCLVGTRGQEKIGETTLPRQYVIPNRPVDIPAGYARYQQLVLEKQELDVFTNPNAEPLLALLGKPEVILYGVVTELCVALAARQLLQRGCAVRLVRDAVRALDEARAQQLFQEVTRLGGSLISTEEVTGRESGLPL